MVFENKILGHADENWEWRKLPNESYHSSRDIFQGDKINMFEGGQPNWEKIKVL